MGFSMLLFYKLLTYCLDIVLLWCHNNTNLAVVSYDFSPYTAATQRELDYGTNDKARTGKFLKEVAAHQDHQPDHH
jgi:hypothetical protein